ncbi:MAG: ATPase [Oscillospiraceae bacterium]
MSNYFLGETTASGFKTDFGALIEKDGYFTYIIKGGPGCGKSGLMKKVAAEFSKTEEVDLFFCSSDPNSLDAIDLKTSKIIIVDGTSPHIFDASYPGISQIIVNLGECFDLDFLKENASKICKLFNEIAAFHSRANKYVKAISSVNNDIYEISSGCILAEKFQKFIDRTFKKCFKFGEKIGSISYKKISAFSRDGYKTQPLDGYEKIFLLDDNYFSGSDKFLQSLAENAAGKGFDVIVSLGEMFEQSTFEHVLVPEIKTAFLSSNFVNKLDFKNANCINFMRFYDKEKISEKKCRLNFDKKMSEELLTEAVFSVQNAKKLHDNLEEFYIKATDFEKVNLITKRIISEIKSL